MRGGRDSLLLFSVDGVGCAVSCFGGSEYSHVVASDCEVDSVAE